MTGSVHRFCPRRLEARRAKMRKKKKAQRTSPEVIDERGFALVTLYAAGRLGFGR